MPIYYQQIILYWVAIVPEDFLVLSDKDGEMLMSVPPWEPASTVFLDRRLSVGDSSMLKSTRRMRWATTAGTKSHDRKNTRMSM